MMAVAAGHEPPRLCRHGGRDHHRSGTHPPDLIARSSRDSRVLAGRHMEDPVRATGGSEQEPKIDQPKQVMASAIGTPSSASLPLMWQASSRNPFPIGTQRLACPPWRRPLYLVSAAAARNAENRRQQQEAHRMPHPTTERPTPSEKAYAYGNSPEEADQVIRCRQINCGRMGLQHWEYSDSPRRAMPTPPKIHADRPPDSCHGFMNKYVLRSQITRKSIELDA